VLTCQTNLHHFQTVLRQRPLWIGSCFFICRRDQWRWKKGDRKSSPQTDMAWNDMKWCQLTCKKANLVWKSTKWMRLMRWMSECLVRKAELTKKKIPMKLCCAQKWWSGDLPVVNLGVFETRG
jgi:hypothetical protein